MKRFVLKLVTVCFGLLLLVNLNVNSQPSQDKEKEKTFCPKMICKNIPDLTDEQKSKIENLHLESMKKMKDIKNQLREKHARLQTLETADKPDMNEINLTIDDLGKLKVQAMKNHASERQEIRKLLSEKQKIYFDNHAGRKEKKQHKGRKHYNPE